MILEAEAAKALQDGQLAETLMKGIGWTWLIIALGIPIFGMIIYKYVLTSLADRLMLFLSNEPWTDKGKLIEYGGERWMIKKINPFRVYLTKAAEIKNRGKLEKMKKTLTIPVSKYIDSNIVYYEYKDLYSEEKMDGADK